jgi:hypothetical protein
MLYLGGCAYLQLPRYRLAYLVRVILLLFRIFNRWNRESGTHTARPVFKDFFHSSKVVFWKSSDIMSVNVIILDRDNFTIIATFKSNRACNEDLDI